MDEFNIKVKIGPIDQTLLDLYYYDNLTQSWTKNKNFDKININKPKLQIITWNILGALKYESHELFAFPDRSKAVNNILKELDADIICLQEVSKKWLIYFLEQDWIKKMYYCSEKDPDRVHYLFGLSNVVFSKIPLYNIISYGLISLQLDTFLTFDIFINNNKYNIGTFQMQSTKEYKDFRIVQLKTMFDLIKNKKDV